MCEINFVYGLKEKTLNKTDISELLSMTKESSTGNADGIGFFNDQSKILKAPVQYTSQFAEQVADKLNGSKFIVSHCRYATTGANKHKNTHPFRVNSFIFCHNGIITNHEDIIKKYKIKDKSETDSIVIGHVIDYHYHKTNDMKSAIQAMAKEIDGTYSVFLYEKSTKTLYYFRHTASFTFALIKKSDEHYVIGSTDEKNLDNKFQTRIFGFPISNATEISRFDPENDTIYTIDSKGIHKIATFDVPEQNYYSDYNTKTGEWNGVYYTKSKKVSVPKKQKPVDFDTAKDTILTYYPDLMIEEIRSNTLLVSNSRQFMKDFKGHCFKRFDETSGHIRPKTLVKIANKLNTKQEYPEQFSEGCYMGVG